MTKKQLPELLRRWNVAERVLRELLCQHVNGKLSAEECLCAIDCTVANATKRGCALDMLVPIHPNGRAMKLADELYRDTAKKSDPALRV